METSTKTLDEKEYMYVAFISCRSQDGKHARWLKRELLSYRIPVSMANEHSSIRSRNIKPVFLFTDDNISGELSEEIKDAISKSKYLIVICSNHIKEKPDWINKEITFFLEAGNSPNMIIPLIVEKSPYHTKDIYPPILCELKERGVNIAGPGFYDSDKLDRHKAFIRLISRIHGIEPCIIEEQDKKIVRIRRIRQAFVAVLITAIILFSLAILKAPSITMTSNGSDTVNAEVDDIIAFDLDIENLSKTDPVLVQIHSPEGVLINDYCQIHYSNGTTADLPVDVFGYEVDISDYITDDSTRLSFSATITDDGLELGENLLYVRAVAKTPSRNYDDTVVVNVTPSGSDISDNIDWGWGDSDGGRESVTQQEYNDGKFDDFITFNRISDGVIGHEFNFVAAREYNSVNDGKFKCWRANKIEIRDGKTYIIRMYIHNLCCLENANTANDVRCWFDLPSDTSSQLLVNGIFESSNASPSTYWDSVVFIADHDFKLEYVKGSATIENNYYGDGYSLPDEITGEEGALIGYDKMDGQIPGGYQYSCYLTIIVKVLPAE